MDGFIVLVQVRKNLFRFRVADVLKIEAAGGDYQRSRRKSTKPSFSVYSE